MYHAPHRAYIELEVGTGLQWGETRSKPPDRAVFWTWRGYTGVGSPAIKTGDCVFMLHGGQFLYILRALTDDEMEFVGECYIHGLKFGKPCSSRSRMNSRANHLTFFFSLALYPLWSYISPFRRNNLVWMNDGSYCQLFLSNIFDHLTDGITPICWTKFQSSVT